MAATVAADLLLLQVQEKLHSLADQAEQNVAHSLESEEHVFTNNAIHMSSLNKMKAYVTRLSNGDGDSEDEAHDAKDEVSSPWNRSSIVKSKALASLLSQAFVGPLGPAVDRH